MIPMSCTVGVPVSGEGFGALHDRSADMTGQDWQEWHERYDDPRSSMSRRVAIVQRMLRRALDAAPLGPVSLISMCAGQGRDVIGVLTDHPRAPDVRALLVELDARNAAR